MTHRRIKDGGGKVWDVWEVYPSAVERRMSGEHPVPVLPPDLTEERRTKREVRVVVPTALQDGWLAFQNADERRRLAPIPDAWASLDDDGLLDLLARAERIPVRK